MSTSRAQPGGTYRTQAGNLTAQEAVGATYAIRDGQDPVVYCDF
ncbi:MAG: hypothetical protein ACYC3X_25310 [Pirellulaceae bacterium]